MVDRNMSLDDFFKTRHAELDLYVVTLGPNPSHPAPDTNSAEFRELLRRHFVYWWELEERGKLFAAGPTDVGTPQQAGMAILMAASLQEAEQLAAAEPMHRAGLRINTVRPWQLNEGTAVPVVKAALG